MKPIERITGGTEIGGVGQPPSSASLLSQQAVAAFYEVSRLLPAAATLSEAGPQILRTLCEHLDWDFGELWQPQNKEGLVCTSTWRREGLAEVTVQPKASLAGASLPAAVLSSRKAAWTTEVANNNGSTPGASSSQEELRSGFAFPVHSEGRVNAVIAIFTRAVFPPDRDLLTVMESLGQQIGHFAHRRRIEANLQERVRQHEAIAELSQQALGGIELQELMDDTVTRVADVLDADYCKVLELMPGGTELLLRSGVGWADGLVGQGIVSTGLDSQAGYTLESASPVIVEDLTAEDRFSGPPLLWDHGVISGMSTIIRTRDGVYGVLGVHTKQRRLFTTDDVNFLQSVANILGSAVQREYDEREIRESELRYRELVGALGVAVYTTDAEGRITYYNQPAVDLWGREPDLGVDMWCGSWRLYWADGTPMRHDECPMAITLKENRPVTGAELIAERPDGAKHNIVPYPAPLRDAQGNLVGAVNVLIDITRRRVTERALEESEERLRLALEAGAMGAWEWDVKTGQINWSRTLEQIHGLPEGGFGGNFESYVRDIHPDDVDHVQETITQSFDTGSHQLTYRIIRPDGTIRWLRARGQVLYDEAGKPSRLVGVCGDVTEQREGEKRNSLLAAIVDSSHDAVIGESLEGIVTSWNPAAEATFGYTADEVVGKHLSLIFPDDRADEVRDILARIRTGEGIERQETVRKRKDGTLIDVSSTISPIKDGSGNIVGASAIHRDITAAKRQQDFIMMMAQASTVLAAASPDLSMMMAAVARMAVPALADWCFIDLVEDDGAIKCAAVTHDESEKVQLVLRLRREHLSLHVDSPSPLARVIRTGKSIVNKQITGEAIKEIFKDGMLSNAVMGLQPSSAACVPILARGRTLGVITLAMAESGRRMDDETLAFAEELGRRVGLALDNVNLVRQLETSIESKDEFLGLMSHELRTPITAIYGGARLLRARSETFDTETRSQVVSDIEEESERLFRMVENLLALSRVELGQQPPTEPVLAQRVIGKVVAAHRERNPSRRLTVDVPADLPPIEAQGTYLEQIVRNILSNAEKYTPKDSELIVSATTQGGDLAVSIQDEGPGIEAGEAEMLFERFYRDDESAKRVRGLGLGLTVCKRLVEAMGGTIRAEACEPQGLRITFTMPIHEEGAI